MPKFEYVERFYRTYKTTPIMMRRALGSAMSIIDHVEQVDFADLTFTAFAICSDKRYQELVRPFEQQLELAKVNEAYFVEHLHDFYLAMAKKIRKDPIPYFELLAFIHDRVFAIPITNRDTNVYHIYCAYMDLFAQMADYLHTNQFDTNEHVVGIKTDGKLLCKQEPFPNLDVAVYEYERQLFKNVDNYMSIMRRTFPRYGYTTINSEDDLQKYNTVLRTYDNNILMMIPWINEYTYDLLPERLPDPYCKVPKTMRIGYHPDKERFAKRRRTLPSNGVCVKLAGHPLIEEIYMKELYHADSIHMIGRVRLKAGDYLVRFNTSNGLFLSTFLNSTNSEATIVHDLLESAALWLYSSYVLDDVGEWDEYFDGGIVEKEAIGGKLRVAYGGRKKDKDNLEQSDRTINGYVRKLPVGQRASDEARDRAERLGFELDEGETYVQSFIRSSWVVKVRG